MRKNLLDLIEKTIVYKYDLPNDKVGIQKTIISTQNDKCYSSIDKNNITEIIYNSIIEYSFNEFELIEKDYQNLHSIALKTRLKYNTKANSGTKIKYGFLGEVLLYSILYVIYKAKPLIARGYFYNPLENSETKGYDSYQLIENNGITELWFGEVKFHSNHEGGIKNIFKNIYKALSDEYLERNILALPNHRNNFNYKGSQIEKILDKWEKNPAINILQELKTHKIKLIYPILLIYSKDDKSYDDNIKKVPQFIKDNFKTKKIKISVDYSVFFILVPLEKVKEIKTDVIKWIESKKQLI